MTQITQHDNGTWTVTTGPLTTTFADDPALAAVQIGMLQQEIYRYRNAVAYLRHRMGLDAGYRCCNRAVWQEFERRIETQETVLTTQTN